MVSIKADFAQRAKTELSDTESTVTSIDTSHGSLVGATLCPLDMHYDNSEILQQEEESDIESVGSAEMELSEDEDEVSDIESLGSEGIDDRNMDNLMDNEDQVSAKKCLPTFLW